jgi:ABC-type lipoprotein release transport system permease subunit
MALISERTAQRFWPGQDPIGRRLKLSGRPQNYRPMGGDLSEPWVTIAGIVGNVRQRWVMSEPGLDVYLCDQQLFSPESYLAIRTTLPPASLIPHVKRAVWNVDPEQSTFDVQTMSERVRKTTWQQELAGITFAIFAGLAVMLAAVGTYGVMSYTVNQRTREFGIRMALGARPSGVVRMLLREGLILVLAGVLSGAIGALVLTRLLSSSLYAVTASDPMIYACVSVVLTGMSLIACYLPARRALQADPIVTLRQE